MRRSNLHGSSATCANHVLAHSTQVVTAANGEQAIFVARASRPDLILMDLNLPELDGFTATQHIHGFHELRNVPILAVTAYGLSRMEEAARPAGCAGYIRKPVDFDELESQLNVIFLRS